MSKEKEMPGFVWLHEWSDNADNFDDAQMASFCRAMFAKNPETTNPWDFGYFGRDSLKRYFEDNSRISKKKGISIVVVAAQWYASIVERKGYTVLDPRTVASSLTYNFDSIVGPVLDKYGLKKLAIDLKRELGQDQFYIQDQDWKQKPFFKR